MNISTFTICYNEEIILQKFINHYRTRFPNCEITIYDNMSTDNSRQIVSLGLIDAQNNKTYLFHFVLYSLYIWDPCVRCGLLYFLK